jgi:hypothetical protein
MDKKIMAFAVIAIIALIVSVVSLSVALTLVSENQHYSSSSTFSPTVTPIPVINGHPKLICNNTNLSVAFEPGVYTGHPNGYYYLAVNATISNTGNVTANKVSLWIQTYFPNGTEAINYNMTLYYFWVAIVSWNPADAPQTVSIYPNQSYLVQTGNLIEDENGKIHQNGFPTIPDLLVGNNDFYASYKLTAISENS